MRYLAIWIDQKIRGQGELNDAPISISDDNTIFIPQLRISTKKKSKEIVVDPENIDFERFSSPELLEHMDNELKQFVQQQGSLQTLVGKETPCAVAKENRQERRISVQRLEVPLSTIPQETSKKKGRPIAILAHIDVLVSFLFQLNFLFIQLFFLASFFPTSFFLLFFQLMFF